MPPLTLGLWLDVLRAVGVPHPKGIPVPEWDAAEATPEECLALITAACGRVGRVREEAARELAAGVWAALSQDAAEQLGRANTTSDALQESLGNWLTGEGSVTLARVLYKQAPADLNTVLAWPIWRALEWMMVRSIEEDYQAEEDKLAETARKYAQLN